jgi:hypothetical protein
MHNSCSCRDSGWKGGAGLATTGGGGGCNGFVGAGAGAGLTDDRNGGGSDNIKPSVSFSVASRPSRAGGTVADEINDGIGSGDTLRWPALIARRMANVESGAPDEATPDSKLGALWR